MISPFTNPSYLLPPLVAFVLNIGLAVFIWRTKPKKDLSTNLFIGMLISLGVWGLVLFGMRTSSDVGRALIWDRGMPIASLATFIFFYHFTHAYTHTRGQRAIITAAYIALGIITVLSPLTDLFVEQIRVEDYGYAPVVGIGSYIVVISFIFFTVAAIRNLMGRHKESPSYRERNKLIYLAIGAVLIITGTYLDVLTNLPPVMIKTSIAFSILGTIVVVKYDLLDIRYIARRSLAYVITSSAIAISYILVILYLDRTIGLERSPIWLHAIMIVAISVGIRPLYTWSQQVVDKFFYRGRYDYLKALENFASQTQSIVNLKQLCNTVVELANGAMQTTRTCLLLPSEEKRGFVIESINCAGELKSETMLKNSSATVKWLTHHSDIISLDQFDIHPQLQSLPSAERKKLEDLGARLIAPIKTKEGGLSGLLVIGEKKSPQPFSREDKQLLRALSSHVSMSLKNALLYKQVQNSERALRESEEKLRLTFDSMAEGVAVADIEARITEVNKALVDILGYRHKEDLIGKSIYSLIPENDRAGVKKNIEEMLNAKNTINGETMLLERDGSLLDAEISSASIRGPTCDTPTGSVTIIEDITKRKHLEADRKAMERKAQISSRLASVGEMASGIAHEINNPLTGVIGFADLLMKKDIPEDIRKYVETIHNGAQRVAGIIARLLTFARQEKPNQDSVNINEILGKTRRKDSMDCDCQYRYTIQ